MKPLVSILIPAYNAEDWLADSIRSAVTQTWSRKEIVIVNDGSEDRTAEIAGQFAAKNVLVVSTENRGVTPARNRAYELSQGDYIQWLDADDLLSPDKIELQLAALGDDPDPRILLSSPWAHFNFRTHHARFIPSRLWADLSPVEFLLRKMGENLHMQTSTWLTSRELTEAAGPWDTRLKSDDDGEYFCRALLASKGTKFVPGAKVFYRNTPSLNRVSYMGRSDEKRESMLLSMKLHVGYLRSLEESERVRKVCLFYLQSWFNNFYPERPDLVAELQSLAAELGGKLEVPRLRWKYAWMKPIFGWKTAQRAQRVLPQLRSALVLNWDKLMYRLEKHEADAKQSPEALSATQKHG